MGCAMASEGCKTAPAVARAPARESKTGKEAPKQFQFFKPKSKKYQRALGASPHPAQPQSAHAPKATVAPARTVAGCDAKSLMPTYVSAAGTVGSGSVDDGANRALQFDAAAVDFRPASLPMIVEADEKTDQKCEPPVSEGSTAADDETSTPSFGRGAADVCSGHASQLDGPTVETDLDSGDAGSGDGGPADIGLSLETSADVARRAQCPRLRVRPAEPGSLACVPHCVRGCSAGSEGEIVVDHEVFFSEMMQLVSQAPARAEDRTRAPRGLATVEF